jgi:integrase
MGLELRRDADHNLRSKWWYGRYTVNGKRRFINLDVEVQGKPPADIRQTGSTAFECSRALAQTKLNELIRDATSHKSAEKHLQELYELKAGKSIERVPVADISAHWLLIPIRRERSASWERTQCSTLKDFSSYIKNNHPAAQYISQITPKMAREWLRSLEVRRYASATYNDKLHLLKGFFERIGHEAGVMKNPFSGCPTKIKKTMHRQPFTQDELNAILTHCDELTRPVVMTAMCTAMRRGDCSMLKWESVDLENGFISVKTSKTGELAEIPLFPLLRAELEKLPRVSEYVFPKVAAMYTENIHGLSWRFKQALKVAGIKGTVIAREDARHKASVKDFHSLRTTWITMALSAGVPMELVRRVTGHSTVEVVLKHYFRPGREAFRTALETAMPHMLTGGATPAKAIQAGQVLAQEARTLSHEELTKKVEGLAAVIAA